MPEETPIVPRQRKPRTGTGETVVYPATPDAAVAHRTRQAHPVPGIIQVRVMVAHDGLHAGTEYQMILNTRTENLIKCGYLEVVMPTGDAPWASW